MVSALVYGSNGLGLSPDRGHCVAFLGKTLLITLILPLSTLVYKWVPANLMLGITLQWTGIPSSGGSRSTVSRFMLRKPG